MTQETTDATRRGMMGAASLGLLVAGLTAGRAGAQGQSWTAAEQANVKIVNDFLAATKPKDMTQALTYMADDCVYRLTETSPPATGHEAIARTLAPYVDNAEKITFDISATFASGPIVINHRIDRFVSTVRPLSFEGVGVFFIKNGKIKEWTDFTIRAALANKFPGEA